MPVLGRMQELLPLLFRLGQNLIDRRIPGIPNLHMQVSGEKCLGSLEPRALQEISEKTTSKSHAPKRPKPALCIGMELAWKLSYISRFSMADGVRCSYVHERTLHAISASVPGLTTTGTNHFSGICHAEKQSTVCADNDREVFRAPGRRSTI